MQLRVAQVSALTANVRMIRLEAVDGTPLPSFTPGSHLTLDFQVGDQAMQRKYSLISDPDGGAYYEIAVKRHPKGRAGSIFLHDTLPLGATLEASAPISEFGLATDGRHHVLIAGGIGITPMLSIVSQLRRSNASYELHYSARSREAMVLQDRVLDRGRERVALYFTQSESYRRMDVDQLIAEHADHDDTHFYVCGPAALIDRVRLAAQARGVQKRRVHFESFGPAWTRSDGTVKLSLSESGIDLEVPAGTNLLDAMEAAGAWLPSDCRRGECGACIASYTSGSPIHRDHCLSEEQRAHSLCPCVSWASPTEVLTLQL